MWYIAMVYAENQYIEKVGILRYRKIDIVIVPKPFGKTSIFGILSIW